MSRISDLMVRQGDVEAQRALNKGQALSGAVVSLSDMLPGIRRRRLEDQDRQTQQRQVDSRLATDELQRKNIQGQIDERGNERMDEAATKDLARSAAEVNSWLTSVAGMPEGEQKKAAYLEGRNTLIANGRLTPADAPEFFPGQSWVKSRLSMLLPATERFKQLFPEPEKPPAPVQIDTVDDNGNPVTRFETPTPGASFQKPKPKETPEELVQVEENGKPVWRPRSQAAGMPAYRPPVQGAQPTDYKLVGPNGEQRIVKGADAANTLLAEGWKQYDAVGARQSPGNPEEAANLTRAALGLVDRLETHPGLDKATGAYEMRGFTQDAVDFNALRDQLVAALALPNLGALKGPMSDRDVLFVKQLATRLGEKRLSGEETRRALADAKIFLQSKVGSAAAPPPSPAPAPGRGAGAGPGPMVPAPGAIVVQTPDGQSFTFPSQQQADVFKRRAGIP